jgi:hypothetical protein
MPEHAQIAQERLPGASGASPGPCRPPWLRRLTVVVLLASLAVELFVAARLLPRVMSDERYLHTLAPETQQTALLSHHTPLAGRLEQLEGELPRDARVFMVNALLVDYYLANYFLYPRPVLVDEPDAVVNGIGTEAVGGRLTRERLKAIGVTHVIIISPTRDSLHVVPLQGGQNG